MKLIIAGSRSIDISTQFINSLVCYHNLMVTEVVSGCARGVDLVGEKWALNIRDICGEDSIKTIQFHADWDKHGKKAGPIRNKEMADYADALLLIWDGSSPGSKNMKETMLKLEKPVYEVILKTWK